jgi:hypothetical protein
MLKVFHVAAGTAPSQATLLCPITADTFLLLAAFHLECLKDSSSLIGGSIFTCQRHFALVERSDHDCPRM